MCYGTNYVWRAYGFKIYKENKWKIEVSVPEISLKKIANTINWLPADQRLHRILNVTVFKYVNHVCPYYMKEVFEYASRGKISSKNNYATFKVPFRKTNIGQKSLSYTGPSVWNKLLSSMKRNINLNKIKRDVKTIFKN